MFIIIACNDITSEEIEIVENMLGTNLPSKYTVESDEPFDTADTYKIIDITIDKDDFKELLTRIDTTEFVRVKNYLSKGIRHTDEEGFITSSKALTIFVKENRIKYSEKN